jgi:hypothetical protein
MGGASVVYPFSEKNFSATLGTMEFDILRLDLRSPLLYTREPSLDPFGVIPLRGEYLFCFMVNPEQGFRIDPEGAAYLGTLVDGGKQDLSPEGPRAPSPCPLELPRGKYLFAQVRERLGRENSIDLAMEIQKEGLWERLRLGPRLYLRYLFEDRSPVTQVFRPLI